MIAPYVPLLKGKAGELDALGRLSGDQKLQLTPLIDVPQIAIESSEEVPKSLDDYLDRKVTRMAKAWQGVVTPLLIDLFDTDPAGRTKNGQHPVSYLFESLRRRGIPAIPTTGLDRDDGFQSAVQEVVTADKRGVCLRMLREDLSSAFTLASSLNDLLDKFKVARQQAVLLLDFRKLDAAGSADILATAAKIVNGMPGIEDWRAVIFAGSSMPQSLAEKVKAKNAINVGSVDRVEHQIWLDLLKQKLKRRLAFGDYGVVHPDLTYMDPKEVNASAAIRYTVQDRWLIVRGKSLRENPIGYKQFYSLSKALTEQKEFMGSSYSWGDSEIQKRARRQGTTGNLTTWVAVATNHHLTFVSKQVASAFGS
jgi:hypothetical protein